jgi:outer membrane protein OmpA-like peptidoglycan-associated protein
MDAMTTGILRANLAAASSLLVCMAIRPASAQPAQQRNGPAPIYRVTVVQRTAKAINYQYRSGPTKIDFRGTVLLPRAKGDATVESRRGRTEIEAEIQRLTAPQRFGKEYLTYVLWAITPEGRPHNIGELIPNASDKAKLHVTTDLQAFALIVTAEPYSAVRQPSDVVVLENEVRPDTVGSIEPVEAKYELLPRGEYTWHVPSDLGNVLANSPKVSMHQYEAITELYQAQNAVGIARAAQAEHYAPDTFARAQRLLAQAEQLQQHQDDFRQVVQSAREAAQTAEDARVIAQKRREDERLRAADAEVSAARAKVSSAQQAKEEAIALANQAQADADAARAQAQAAVSAREQAEQEAAAARQHAARVESDARTNNLQAARGVQETIGSRQREQRVRLLENLRRVLPVLDTTRGLVATVPDSGFNSGDVLASYSTRVAQIAALLANQPGLRVSVQGYSGDAGGEAVAEERADAVRRVLVNHGMPASSVSAAGLGDTRPLVSNATPQGRTENSRVEIVIAGDPIGAMPLWEQTYSLNSTTP